MVARVASLFAALWLGLAAATAQDEVFVATTIAGRAVLDPEGAALKRGGAMSLGATVAVARGDSGGGLLAIGENAMTRGVTLFLVAPTAPDAYARLSFRGESDDSGNLVALTLDRGYLSVTTRSEDAPVLRLSTGSVGPIEGLWAAPGQILLANNDGVVEVGYRGPGELAFAATGKEITLRSGEAARISSAGVESTSASWGDPFFSASVLQDLMLAGAKEARDEVGASLFNEVTSWDRRAAPRYVRGRIESSRFTPEQRQVNFSVAALNRVSSPLEALPATVSFEGANEVPPVSPAALSVINIANNVTAIVLNREARQLLTQTGSIGLGFGGLGQLALPGLFGGVRSVGPSGLGANGGR